MRTKKQISVAQIVEDELQFTNNYLFLDIAHRERLQSILDY